MKTKFDFRTFIVPSADILPGSGTHLRGALHQSEGTLK